MSRTTTDVLVVGSGPAGSVAAARLATAGARVRVLEQQRHPRYKTCGGGIVGRLLRDIPEAVHATTEVAVQRAVLGFSDLPQEYVLADSEPVVRLVMRDRLDATLLQEAQRAGAVMVEDCRVTAAEQRDGCWHLSTTQGAFAAPCVVAADGAQSRMARAAGWGGVPHGAPALEWEIEVDERSAAEARQEVRFDFDAALQGYAWVFPKRQRLSVGILSTRRAARGLRPALQHYLERRGLRPRTCEEHAWMIPIRPRGRVLGHRGVVLVGDAAGLVDPVTCEGISAAVHSGGLAATAWEAAAGDPATLGQHYQQALVRSQLAELRWARRLLRVLYGPRWLRSVLFGRFGERFCQGVGSIIQGRHTYRSLLAQPGVLRRLLQAPGQRLDAVQR